MINLHDESYATPGGEAMHERMSARATVAAILRVEAALARAQAALGVIPVAAAEEIAERVRPEFCPPEAIARHRAKVGHPLVAVLDAWREQLSAQAGDWLHYGATTADIFNTVLMLQLGEACDDMVATLGRVQVRLTQLAREHHDTPMVARTLGRHAQPITFGLKVAVWLAEQSRSIERLRAWRAQYRAGILSGAVGSYAAFGEHGPQIERDTLHLLGMSAPESVDWKGSRDRFAAFGTAVAIAARTSAHIAHEVFLLNGDDIDEVRETNPAVGSSTMPHKTNPSLCIEVVSKSREVCAHVLPLLEWIGVVHDRDSVQHGHALRDQVVQMGDLLWYLERLVGALQVMPANMTRNLGRTGGQILSEALLFRLAPVIGKPAAHHALHEAAEHARRQGCSFEEALRECPQAREALPRTEAGIDWLSFTGLSSRIALAVADEASRANEDCAG